MKKLISLLVVSLFALTTLFSAQLMTATWEWNGGDEYVAYYRYQLDSTDEDGWVVVDSSVTTYSQEDLDPYVAHTLYIESSYDGENWSETASATAEPLLSAPDTPEEVTEPREDVVVVEEPAEDVVVEETPVVAEANTSPSRFAFSLLVRGGITSPANMTRIAPAFYSVGSEYIDPNITAGLSLDFANIITADNALGFGLRFDFDYIADPKTAYAGGTEFFNPNGYYNDVSATVLLTMDARAGVMNLQFGLGAGTTAFLGQTTALATSANWDTSMNGYDVAWNVFGEALVGVRFYIGDIFSLGLEGYYRIMIPNYEDMDWGANLVLGFTF